MYQGKSVLVVGAARSGIAAARFLAQRGARVTITDQKKGEALASARAQLAEFPITWEEGGNNPASAQSADLVVVSPGVPRENPALTAALAAGKEVIGEVELAARHITGTLVAITGSNGKSTTTSLVGEMLLASGQKTFVGGNLGTPLIEAADKDFDVVVAEISSFQLEWVSRFRPQVAAILNLSPNHLDRHASFEEYRDLKLKLFTQLTPRGVAVWNHSDPVLREWCPKVTQGRSVKPFALTPGKVSAWIDDGSFWVEVDGEPEQYSLSSLRLRGKHNWENVLAALLLARHAGATANGTQAALLRFAGLAHRLEPVRRFAGVEYVNDSKATSVAATVCALEAFPVETKIVLLAGGRGKGASYAPLLPLVRERCRAVVLFGEDALPMQTAFTGATEIEVVQDLSQAVETARALAMPGDAVLLAPACSSLDQFPNFEVRGDTFRALVKALS